MLVWIPLAFTCVAAAVELPPLLYGTAWKKENTTVLLDQALAMGYSGFDAANQKAHYEEALVGRRRADLTRKCYSQTKFSFKEFQYDGNFPYDENSSITQQVFDSMLHPTVGSLHHLSLQKVDALLLHGPLYQSNTLSNEDIEAWRAMERLKLNNQVVEVLGITNFTPKQLDHLCIDIAVVKPAVLQTRCLVTDNWSLPIRNAAKRCGVKLQCYSIFSRPNRRVLHHGTVLLIAKMRQVPASQVLTRFILQYFDAQVIAGSSNSTQMRDTFDAVYSFPGGGLTVQEVEAIAAIGLEQDFTGEKVHATFANEYAHVIRVYWWSNNKNTRVLNLEIPPGKSFEINTFHEHKFQVVSFFKNDDEEVLIEEMTINAQRGNEQTFRFAPPQNSIDEL